MLLIRAVDNQVIHTSSILLHEVYWFSVQLSRATSPVRWLSSKRGNFSSTVIILVTTSLLARIVMVFKTLVCSPFNLLKWRVVQRVSLYLVTTKASDYIFTDFDISNKIARAVKHVLLEVLPPAPLCAQPFNWSSLLIRQIY